MDKKILRNDMRRRLKQMDEATYFYRSHLIQERLLREPSIVEGKTIAVTMSRFPEVETREIIKALWQLGKTVVVPKCQSQTHEMEFYMIDNFNQLEIIYFGIEEPILTQTKYISKREIDVIIVPGIVFNKAGYRVGFGGGYYDRYLLGYTGEKISLAFDEQVTEQVPIESHDIPVNIILTDKQRILARKSEE